MADNSNKSEEPKLREISDEELKKILAEHTKWLNWDEKEGQRADLSNANLKRKKLYGISLCKANLQGAALNDADLQDSDLEAINLFRANLNNASLPPDLNSYYPMSISFSARSSFLPLSRALG